MPVYPQDCDKCEKKLQWEAFLRVFFSYRLTHNPNTGDNDTKWYVRFYNEDLNKEEYVELKKIIDFYSAAPTLDNVIKSEQSYGINNTEKLLEEQ